MNQNLLNHLTLANYPLQNFAYSENLSRKFKYIFFCVWDIN